MSKERLVRLVEEEEFKKLKDIAIKLCGGNDRERDSGNALLYVLQQLPDIREEVLKACLSN